VRKLSNRNQISSATIFSKFKAVVPQDLFEALDAVYASEKVSDMWRPWTEVAGFPLVTAELEDKTLKLTQKRFMRSGLNHDKTEKYNIPISFVIDSKSYDNIKPLPANTFKAEEAQKLIELPEKPSKYYILNPKQMGFYRVNYDAENWIKIKEGLMKDDHDKIDVLNRAQIIDDLFNLARGGVIDYKSAVDVIRYIKQEKNYIPWLSAVNGLTFLSQRVNGKESQEVFSWFIRDTMADIYDHLKFDSRTTDRRTDIYNRANVMAWTCKYGHKACIKSAQEVFAKFMTGTPIPKDQRSYVYCNAVRYGSETEFDFLFERFRKTDVSVEELNILNGLSCSQDEASITVRVSSTAIRNGILMKFYFSEIPGPPHQD
jgi:aminopeptidase N